MIGSIFLAIIVGVVVVALFAVLRNVLVEAVTSIAQLVAGVLDAALKVAVRLVALVTRLIDDAYIALRNIHGETNAEYGRFWDVFMPILFLALLGVLGYADYQLFAARIGPLLGLNQLPQTSDFVLNIVLGALYVVTLFVLGYALSDAYGHSPAGRSLLFGKFGEPVKKVLWGSVAVLGVTTLALALWTFEITVLNSNDDFAAGVFLITFSLLAVFATALCVAPALIGALACVTLLLELVRLVFWLIGVTLWILLNLTDKLAEAIVKVGIDIPAKLGDALYAAARPGQQREQWVQRKPISTLVDDFPLLALTAPAQMAAAVPEVVAPEPVGDLQVERLYRRPARVVTSPATGDAEMYDILEEPPRTNGRKPVARTEKPGGSGLVDPEV